MNGIGVRTCIASFSLHRWMAAGGGRTVFDYIALSKDLGCTHVQPWAAHFHPAVDIQEIRRVGYDPAAPGCPAWYEAPTDLGLLDDIRAAALQAGLGVELIAVDRASVFWPEPTEAAERRRRARRWLDVAARIGAGGIRVDTGGPASPDPRTMDAILQGLRELVAHAAGSGLKLYIENHWGSSAVPENIVAFLRGAEGLRYLFDTDNWAPSRQADGWRMCAPLADATHIKSHSINAAGIDPSVDLRTVIGILRGSGFDGIWGVECFPLVADELETARGTLALIRREVGAPARRHP